MRKRAEVLRVPPLSVGQFDAHPVTATVVECAR